MKTWEKVIAVFVIVSSIGLAKTLDDKRILKKGNPQGFYLECNDKGDYWPCREVNKRPLFWLDGPGSKVSALRRAWKQERWDKEPISTPERPEDHWHRCDERPDEIKTFSLTWRMSPLEWTNSVRLLRTNAACIELGLTNWKITATSAELVRNGPGL